MTGLRETLLEASAQFCIDAQPILHAQPPVRALVYVNYIDICKYLEVLKSIIVHDEKLCRAECYTV